MKKWIAILLCLSLLLCCMPAFAADIGDELLVNGGFDNEAEGWGTWQNGAEGDASFAVEDGAAYIDNVNAVAANYNQSVALEAGKSYRISGKIKTEDVSSQGQGACLSYTGYDADDTWLCETTTTGLFGTNDWTEVETVFTVPDDCVRTVANARIYFDSGRAWFDDLSITEIDVSSPAAGTVNMALTGTPNAHAVDAFGCEWDPKLLYAPSLDKGADESDLELIADRIDKLNIARVRVMMMPEWYEPKNDNDDPFYTDFSAFHFESQGKLNELASLYAYLDICQEKGVKVTLTWWGAQTGAANPWLACKGVTDWVSAPNNLDEMAENISAFMRYAIGELGYTCIDSIILQNEPYYSYQTAQGVVDFDNYVEYYKTVRARLDEDGMKGIDLVGSDDSSAYGWFQNSVNQLTGVVQKFNSHSYNFRAGDYAVDTKIQDFTSARTEATDLPFFYGEFGDGSTVGAYSTLTVDDYERGLFVGVHAINSLKAGSTGSLYWPLHDVYYYSGSENDGNNGGLMHMGLFAFKTEDWRVRPTYQAWGLVCNAALSGNEVYDITDDSDWVEAVATKAESGHWSVLAANRAQSVQTVVLDASTIGGDLELTILSEDTFAETDDILAPTATVTPVDGVYTFDLPPMSFAVLSNLDDADKDAAHEFADLSLDVTMEEEAPTPEPTEEAAEPSPESEIATEVEPTDDAEPMTAEAANLTWVWVGIAVAVIAAAVVVIVVLRKKK